MDDSVNYTDGNRVPSRYIQASQWYSDDERDTTARMSDFLRSLRKSIYSKGSLAPGNRDIRGMKIEAQYATKEQQNNLANDRNARREKLFGSRYADHTEYVPITFVTDSNSKPRSGYLIRSGYPQEDEIVYGLELDDGRSFTAEGAKKFLDSLKDKGGGAAIMGDDEEIFGSIKDYAKSYPNRKEANRKGFLEALHGSVPQAAEKLSANGEIGAFPSNWWGQ